MNVRTRRPGFRDQWPRVVTTLTDPAAYPAGEVAALFGRRWQVEVYFRDLKRTLGMHRLRSRTAAGVRKELAPVLTGPAGARSPCNTVPA